MGIRPHSGWGALVLVAGKPGAVDVIDRRRIVITAPHTKGAEQPYHFSQGLKLSDAQTYLAERAAESEQLAFDALRQMVLEAHRRHQVVHSCAVLLAAGRSLPPLEKILASHLLVHTAEGEFFRQAFRRAGDRLKMQVTGIRERDLEEHARAAFGNQANSLTREIAGLGRSLGSPWTADQKNACLAALLVLNSEL